VKTFESINMLPGVLLEDLLGFLPAEVRGADQVSQQSRERIHWTKIKSRLYFALVSRFVHLSRTGK
jgi:hypothetical protein